jgi:hypothetical protein
MRKEGEIPVISCGVIATEVKEEGTDRGTNKIGFRFIVDKAQEENAYLHIRLREEVHAAQVAAVNRVQLNDR